MLGSLLHAPRGPFYSPKAARSCWRQSWKANLAFCRVAHRTVTVAVRCVISFHFWRIRLLQIHGNWCTGQCLVHTEQSSAPANHWHSHASREDCTADRWRSRPLAHRTVWCSTGQSGEFYSYAVELFPRATSSPRMTHRTVRCSTGQSGEL
jgi:hypothetical protein